GSLLSASNGVAAFHRALHRVFDTREGRPFLWFRTIVFGETVLIVAVAVLAIGMIIMGGEASQRIGEFIGIPRIAFAAWNLVKWPILLVILIIGRSEERRVGKGGRCRAGADDDMAGLRQ